MIEILSPGRIHGEVKIITSFEQLVKEDLSGKVVVIKEITPKESVYLYNANGIIVEQGCLLSHVAIFAREINLPCIKVENATSVYKEGMVVDIK